MRQKRVSDIIIVNVCSKLRDIFSFFSRHIKCFQITSKCVYMCVCGGGGGGLEVWPP